jgi:hypothetical protein
LGREEPVVDTSATLGFSGNRLSISRSRRDIEDFPTATEPATPIT